MRNGRPYRAVAHQLNAPRFIGSPDAAYQEEEGFLTNLKKGLIALNMAL